MWPRVVHQTWLDHKIPLKYRNLREGCRLANPEYEFRMWTDADLEQLLLDHYSWFLPTWRQYPYAIQRVDSARLFVLHQYGGVYLDMDIRCKVPLAKLMKTVFDSDGPANGVTPDVILAETKPLGITNNFMISQPKTAFIDFITHRLVETNGRYFSPHWTVMFTAGPLFVYKSYLKYPCKEQVHLVSQHDHSHVYFTHEQAGTWHRWDGKFITWFDYNGRLLMKVIAMLIVGSLIAVYWRWTTCWCRGKRTRQGHGDTIKTPALP